MKTKNNVQKTKSKTLAVIISLVLISFTVKAQDFWKSVSTNDNYNTIAMIDHNFAPTATGLKSVNSSTNATTAYAELEKEEELEVEDWMLNEDFFPTLLNMEDELEEPMQLEVWMLDDNFFVEDEPKNTNDQNRVSSSKDNSQFIIWNNNKYGNRAIIIVNDRDNQLELEPWLFDSKIWNK
ncbi:MAG: hypothetical protein EOM73_02185 [Bacteroidia bacterium]|nr:hypothetical protein [Bacteroidia bacterium]